MVGCCARLPSVGLPQKDDVVSVCVVGLFLFFPSFRVGGGGGEGASFFFLRVELWVVSSKLQKAGKNRGGEGGEPLTGGACQQRAGRRC